MVGQVGELVAAPATLFTLLKQPQLPTMEQLLVEAVAAVLAAPEQSLALLHRKVPVAHKQIMVAVVVAVELVIPLVVEGLVNHSPAALVRQDQQAL